MKRLLVAMTAVIGVLTVGSSALTVSAGGASGGEVRPGCDDGSITCTETSDPIGYNGAYTGHDEPSVLFYSNRKGSGNSNLYRLTLPTDPPRVPTQNGSGGTFNFQLHPAFWFGMAICDTQSAPEFTNTCKRDTDANIFNSSDPSSPRYIGRHPGTAFMEMQFYAPGWVKWPPGDSCDARKWCAALNIDSLSSNLNTGVDNNSACLNTVGVEPVNFAFITHNGVAQAPANPVDATLATYTPDPQKDLFMNSGDTLTVSMHDTQSGFQVVIHDLTTGQTGSMTASIANQFGQVVYDPTATTCTVKPYAFHPMYATSSPSTRVPWAAHSYNVAFSDEIGHFEYCSSVDPATGSCTAASATDPQGPDADDNVCFPAPDSSRIQIGGCLDTDIDFDGASYLHTWPGSRANPGQDRLLDPSPIRFTSPTFNGGQNFSRAAFEADLPRIEFATNPPCQRFVSNPSDVNPGAGCVNPPAGAQFYPFYSTATAHGMCVWQLGGAHIPGTVMAFGGSSKAEFGPLLKLAYPSSNGRPTVRYNNFRRILSSNPCPA